MRPSTLTAAVAACTVTAAATAMAAPSDVADKYVTDLTTLNDSGVTGRVVLQPRDGGLFVQVYANGLVPGQLHPQHIHGFVDDSNAVVPPPSAAGADGVLSLADGLPSYGPVLLPLLPFSTAPGGSIAYQRFFSEQEIADLAGQPEINGLADLFPLENRVIVIHGGFVDGEYVATLPVAAGEVAVIPLPAGVWGGLMLLGGVGGSRLLKKRRAENA